MAKASEETAAEREAARAALQRAHVKKNDTEDAITQAVVDARAVQVTWREIATELGVQQPNATRKYKPYIGQMQPKNRWENEADPKGPALIAVRHAVKAHEDAKRAEVQAVADARNHDVTWREIAEDVGMAEPNAFVKYSPMLEEKRTVTVRE
ncbi:hypothetical protein [Nonomuraea angiospora]|uniref:hypothetical protein n=1 Tax=Nonomuraea angiospora TaxID=46172 RepID=UPI0029BF3F7E|nr:hypothetical protein [Nonomuraea angiospora]MDX3100506.1 hypothetical protein [Nonomuraea angiospora]